MTTEKTEFKVSIHLVQGDPVQFKLALDLDELRNLGTNIENALNAKYLGVELHGKLQIFPAHNISRIEIDPAPNVLIATVIRDAQPLDNK